MKRQTYLLIIEPESRCSACDVCKASVATRQLMLRAGEAAGLFCSKCGTAAWHHQKEREALTDPPRRHRHG